MLTELLFREDAYLRTATARVLAVSERGIELDRTVFYPQGGGQAGDSGRLLRAPGDTVAIIDTRKGETPDRVLHVLAPGSPVLQPGETVTLEIDWPRRYRLMRLHGAAPAVVRHHRPGHRRQHRARQGATRLRYRPQRVERRADRA